VFCSVNKGDNVAGGRLAGNIIRQLVGEYGSISGLAPPGGDYRLSPHDLQRTIARNVYDNGASLLIIQQLLGHSDPKTTAYYILSRKIQLRLMQDQAAACILS
jgi:integrase